MREHKIAVRGLKRSPSGISFIAQCCGKYEETFNFERVGHYTTAELDAKIQQALAKAQANHEHQLAGEEHLETLLKKYAEGIPNCTECG